MAHKYKEFALVREKDGNGEETGRIMGYFSTYDRIPDAYGEVVAQGAFDETVKKRKESGHPFPLCWNHDLNQIIGSVDPTDIIDTDKGPLMTASFFNTQLAQEKRELVKSGVVFQFSFAYDVLEAGPTEIEEGVKAYELKKVELYEISIVPIPANQHAVVTDIKSGRRNSGKDEGTIRDAISALEAGIASLRSLLDADDNNGKDDAKANGKPEEPEQSNPKKDRLLEYIKNMHTED